VKSIFYLFFVILLTACESSMVADQLIGPGGTLYYDDFSVPSSGWPRTSDASGKMDYDNNGTYHIIVNSPDYDMWAVLGQVFRDVRVEVDATPLAALNGNRYGLICRYRDPQDFYFFIITSDGYYAIGKVSAGTRVLLDQDMMAYSAAITVGGSTNHLRFDCIGQTLTGYVNDQSIVDASDADFLDGNAGLITGAFDQPGVDVSFDNFMVYKP